MCYCGKLSGRPATWRKTANRATAMATIAASHLQAWLVGVAGVRKHTWSPDVLKTSSCALLLVLVLCATMNDSDVTKRTWGFVRSSAYSGVCVCVKE